MNLLIIGSSGTLGKSLYYFLKKKFKVSHNGLTKRKFDLKKKNQVRILLKTLNPKVIINCCGVTDIDYCEKNQVKSSEINVRIVQNFLDFQKEFKFYFIHISTDHLYDSKTRRASYEIDKIKINNEYSRQKRMAEKICLKYKSLIFRTNFFGKSGKKTIDNWLYLNLKKKKKIYLFNDVFFNPLRLESLNKIFEKILNDKKLFLKRGIYNLGSKNSLSKEKFAKNFSKFLYLKHKDFVSINVNPFLKTKRSKNMVMNCKKFEKSFKITLPKLNDEILKESKNYSTLNE